MPDEIHVSNYGLPIPDPAAFSATPQYYNPFPQQSPTCPGWYFCWRGPQADYLYWPGDWSGVSCWVELPAFVQVILQKPPPCYCKSYTSL